MLNVFKFEIKANDESIEELEELDKEIEETINGNDKLFNTFSLIGQENVYAYCLIKCLEKYNSSFKYDLEQFYKHVIGLLNSLGFSKNILMDELLVEKERQLLKDDINYYDMYYKMAINLFGELFYRNSKLKDSYVIDKKKWDILKKEILKKFDNNDKSNKDKSDILLLKIGYYRHFVLKFMTDMLKPIADGSVFDEFEDENIVEVYLAREAIKNFSFEKEIKNYHKYDNNYDNLNVKGRVIAFINDLEDREKAKKIIDGYLLHTLDITAENSLDDVAKNAENFSLSSLLALLDNEEDKEYLRKKFVLKIKNIARKISYLNIFEKRLDQKYIFEEKKQKHEKDFKNALQAANSFMLGIFYQNFKNVEEAMEIFKLHRFNDTTSQKST